MRSFQSSTVDRATAIAMARSPRWDEYFKSELPEHSEEIVGIAEPVAGLFCVLGDLCGPASLADLFDATAEGSNLRLVGPIFNFWALSELIPKPPADFDPLRWLHRAAMALSVRAMVDGVAEMSPAQLDATASMRVRRFGGHTVIARSVLEKGWSGAANKLSEKYAQSFPPASLTALACLGGVVQRPACTALHLGRLDPSLRKVMLKKTLEILADCPSEGAPTGRACSPR